MTCARPAAKVRTSPGLIAWPGFSIRAPFSRTRPACGGGLGQRPGAIEAGMEQPFVQPASSLIACVARQGRQTANGDRAAVRLALRLARGARLFPLIRRQTGLASATVDLRASPARPARRALRPCSLPSSDTSLVSSVSASVPVASACSSSSSSRSSMSKRMARPPKTAKPAGVQRGGVTILCRTAKEVSPGAGGAGGASFLVHTPHNKVSSAAASGRSSLGR